jgi:hypothetical protein
MFIRKRLIVILSGAKNLQRIFAGANRFFLPSLLRMTDQLEVFSWTELTIENGSRPSPSRRLTLLKTHIMRIQI